MAAHSRLSASGSSQWLNCPGQPKLVERALHEKLIEPDTGNQWSREGTACHTVMEYLLKNKELPEAYTGRTISKVLITKELVANIRIAYDEIQAILEQYPKAKVFLEKRYKLDQYYTGEDIGGTCDVIVYDRKTRLLWIIDYKFGRGKVVTLDNTQLMIYVLSAFRKLSIHRKIEKIKYSILQPKLKPVMTTEELSPHEVESWQRYVLDKGVKLTKVEPPILIAGPHCVYCDVRLVCTENNKQMNEITTSDFASVAQSSPQVDMIPIKTLTDDQIASVISNKGKIEKWINDVVELATKEARRGREIEGLKPVAKRGSTVYNKDTKKIRAALRRKRIPEEVLDVEATIKSPAQLRDALVRHYGDKEKAMTIWKEHTAFMDGGWTIAHNDDPRKAIEVTTEKDFKAKSTKKRRKAPAKRTPRKRKTK